ncbi:MAG TPA: DNA gyrase modulator, partial [Polyangiaceae bacterium]
MVPPQEPASLEAALRAGLARLQRERDVRYAEVRYVSESTERLRVRDLRPEEVAHSGSSGVAVRVLGEKTWGFACTPGTDEAHVVRAAERALAVARASSSLATRAVPFPP